MAKMTFLLAGLLVVLLLLPAAFAAPVPATGLTSGVSSQRDLSNLNTTSVDAVAGNVTRLDINALSITQSWQGYYGNISGNMVLADAGNNSMYEWGNGTSVTGEVYASRNDTISWATINCSNTTVIAAEETYLGQTSGDADSVTNTFNGTAHPSFLVGGRNMTSCPSTNAFVNGGSQTTDYHQVLLADGSGKTVYTTLIDHGAIGYDGNQWDFELMVGENEHAGSEGPTIYYFFTELG